MLLADTSVWIDHFRKGDPALIGCLARREIVIHPFVIGEIALGHLDPRARTLASLRALPCIDGVAPGELLRFIENSDLIGRGVGLIDAYLLAEVSFRRDIRLWTRDKRLRSIAVAFGVAALLE